GLRSRDLALVTRQLATLVEAGMPLDRALDFAGRSLTAPAVAAALARVRERLTSGAGLADAMAADSGRFPQFYVATIRAGEAGGALGPVMARMAVFLERTEAMREQVRTAMVYPIVLMVTAIAILALMVTVVLPQFEPIFAEAGDRLPAGTRLVIDAARAIRSHGWQAALLVPIMVWMVARALAVPRWRRQWDGLVLRLPVVGALVREVDAARFCRTLSALLANGVGHLSALTIVADVLSNAVLRSAISEVSAGMKEGQGIAGPLDRIGSLPPLALQLVRLGEETGQLDTMLGKAADLLEQEVQAKSERLVGLLTPVMTVVLGCGVGGLIAAILSAMLTVYDLPL
ncbi:MAG: type II secretion system F family protein, partial [Pseudomonadota bacterium]